MLKNIFVKSIYLFKFRVGLLFVSFKVNKYKGGISGYRGVAMVAKSSPSVIFVRVNFGF